MEVKLEETIYLDFVTHRFDTGAITDADSTPTYEVFENDTDTALTITGGAIAKRTSKTGNYRISLPCTAANGFESGKSYNVIASATVNSVAAKGVVDSFIVRASSLSDISTPPTAASIADAVWDEALSGHSTAGTAGKGLSDASAAGDPWSTALPGAYGAGTAGKIVGDNLNAPVGTIDTVVDAIKAKTDNLPAAPAATGDIPSVTAIRTEMDTNSTKLANLDAAVSTRSTYAGGAVASVTAAVTVGTNNDKTGYSLSSAPPTVAEIADGVWDEATVGHQTAGTAGKALTDAGGAGTPPTTSEIADAVWDEALSGHLGAGSTGNALNAAGAAGDPWTTSLPGAYGAGSAGKILGDNLNATVGSRSSHSAADVWAVGSRTLTSFGSLVSDIWANATRTLTAISDSSGITTLLTRIGSALDITMGKVDVNDKSGFSGTATNMVDVSGLATQTSVNACKLILDDLKDEAFGRWVMNPASNTLTLYKANGDLLKVFDLTSTEASVPAYVERTPR